MLVAKGGPRRRAALRGVLAAAGTAILLVALARRFERYAVSGASMEPSLRHGDRVIVDRGAYRRRSPRPREIVLAVDPRDPRREIIQRVGRVGDGGAWLEGDNRAASTDSRTFGPVLRDGILGRVRWRYWPLR